LPTFIVMPIFGIVTLTLNLQSSFQLHGIKHDILIHSL